MTTVTKAELADWLGVTPRALDNHIGLLVRDGRRYVLKDSVRAYCEHIREVAAGRGGEGGVLNLTAERARLAKEQADAQEIRNAVLRGELIRADEAERAWGDHIRQARSAILAVPSRIRQVLGHIGDMEARVIDRELRDALTRLGEPGGEDCEAA